MRSSEVVLSRGGLTASASPVPGAERLSIALTRSGALYLLSQLAMLCAAVNFGNNLAYLLTFVLLAAALVSVAHTYRDVARAAVSVGAITPVFAGRSARVPVRLEQAGDRAVYALEIELTGEARRSVDLAPGDAQTTTLVQQQPTRGRYRIEAVRISSTFPLGVVRIAREVRIDRTVWVYPAPAPQGVGYAGTATSKDTLHAQSAGGDDFIGLRTYRPGDSLRHVFWKALAKHPSTQRPLLVKEYGDAVAGGRILDWARAPGPDPEARLSQLCRAVLDAEREGGTYGLRLPAAEIAPGRGAAHRDRCLALLAEYPHSR